MNYKKKEGVIMRIHELTLKVFLTKNIKSYESLEKIANLIVGE